MYLVFAVLTFIVLFPLISVAAVYGITDATDWNDVDPFDRIFGIFVGFLAGVIISSIWPVALVVGVLTLVAAGISRVSGGAYNRLVAQIFERKR